MNAILHQLRLVMLLLLLTGFSGWSQGVIIWNGSVINFDHPVGSGTGVQDQLTPNVWLTRDLTQGLINAATETDYMHFFSPQDTEWAYGSLADYASLGYANWEVWNSGKPLYNIVGAPAVVHLISENIYLSLTFTSWAGPGGAYSYDRSTPSTAVPEPSVWALCGLAGLCLLASATNGARAVPAPGTPPRKPTPQRPVIL